MRNTVYILIASVFLMVIACQKQDSNFLVSETSIGQFNKEVIFADVEALVGEGFVEKDTFQLKEGENPKKIKVFEKGGKHLLTLTASNDSIPKIENINIIDARYTTGEGLNLKSTFKDIQDAYEIKKIVTTLNSVVIFPKSSNLYFTIDKSELPANLRFTSSNIEAVQIPDDARIKYLMLGWTH
ncbi:hypothetical protein [Croceivirga thetidis]|uniref:Uncharacterized protein n=1 Tax=Croceivirga thetidis TaxID=2721623 RepID=A0ABX1GT93_9FLAO|nr:hypothetical protein [Croceivirga thetidis]NKI33174.1 hypothetical protein [Croceivirga thetidis]